MSPGGSAGRGRTGRSGGEIGSSNASSWWANPGWNHTPPGRFIESVTIISAHASHCVTLALADMVTPVPVTTATRPARRTASRRRVRSDSETSAIRAVCSTV